MVGQVQVKDVRLCGNRLMNSSKAVLFCDWAHELVVPNVYGSACWFGRKSKLFPRHP